MSRLIDWKSVCLVCLKKGENRSIFERDNDSNLIADKIIKCADIFTEKDIIQPKSICLQCLDNLNVTHKFRCKYKQSDSIIKALLRTNHQEFQMQDLWKTTPFTEAQQNESVKDEILQIEPSANTNETNIKHEIIENGVVDATHDNETSPCSDFGDNINTEAKLVLKDSAETCFQGSAIKQNDVKATESKKLTLDANDEISKRLRNESTTSFENVCDKPSRKAVYKKALKICEICNRSFKDQHNLDIHMRRHNNERPFSCDHCDKAYMTSGDLRRHMRGHTGEKPYECQYCDRRFAETSSRKNHERTHTGERPFVCPTCGKSFAYSHGLSVHRRIHTGVKKFKCEECGKGFDKRVRLERHVAGHLIHDKLDKSLQHKQKKVLEKEIFHIEECAQSNEINIKHEIIENDVVEDTHDNDNTPCIDSGGKINTEAKFGLNDPAEACFQRSAIEPNYVKANDGNKLKQDAIDEISGRLTSESKAPIENSCDKPSPETVYKKPLKICEICNRGFRYQAKLTIHMRRHNNERPFSCDRCDKAFVSSTFLRRHMRGHTGEKPYECQYCDRRFAEKGNRKNHERTHTGERPFVCPTCGKSFAYSHVLTKHRRIHTKFICEECGKGFAKRVLLKRHVARHLSRHKLDKSSEHKQKKVMEKEIFQVEECAKSNEINIKHEIIETDVVDDTHDNDNSPCVDLGGKINTEELVLKDPAEACYKGSAIEVNDVKANEGNKIKQNANDYIFGRLSESKASIENSCDKASRKTVYKKTLKICEICNRAYKGQAEFDMHMRRHNNERPFSCDRCDKAYMTSGKLRRHMRGHTGEKPYKCQHCERRFVIQTHRKEHERTHTGERPFVCLTCGKRYTHSGSLSQHRRSHTGQRRFVCKQCGKGFDMKNHFEKHLTRHLTGDELEKSSKHKQNSENHKCLYCERQFSDSRSKKNHESHFHTGERPYVCSTCGKSFVTNFRLTRHSLIHKQGMYLQKKRQRIHEEGEKYVVRHMAQDKLDKSSEHKQKGY